MKKVTFDEFEVIFKKLEKEQTQEMSSTLRTVQVTLDQIKKQEEVLDRENYEAFLKEPETIYTYTGT